MGGTRFESDRVVMSDSRGRTYYLTWKPEFKRLDANGESDIIAII
jgi:hypothetical protein